MTPKLDANNCNSSNGHLRLAPIDLIPIEPSIKILKFTAEINMVTALVSVANFPIHDKCWGVNFYIAPLCNVKA